MPQPDGEALQLAGFEVVDAVRQWGTIAVQVSGNWQIQWSETRHVQQIDEPALFGRDEPAATFEYSVQPYSLRAHVKSQETHVRVEGDYVVLVDRDEAELRARLKYAIRGAKVRALEVDAPGWDIDLIGPGTLVNVDAVAVGQNNPLVIPLLQAVSGEFEVTFTARQKIMPESGAVSLRVPVPHGQSVGAANVTIVPADNVELVVEPEATTDLVTQSLRPKTLELPERQQEPLYLRTSGPVPTFMASLKVHRQELSTSVAAEVEIDDDTAQVDERMIHQISYEPTDHLLVSVPRALRPDALAMTLDGQRLAPSIVREPGDESSSAMVPMRLALPTPRIGRCEVQVKYSVPHDKFAQGASTLVEVPLVIPGEGTLTANVPAPHRCPPWDCCLWRPLPLARLWPKATGPPRSGQNSCRMRSPWRISNTVKYWAWRTTALSNSATTSFFLVRSIFEALAMMADD